MKQCTQCGYSVDDSVRVCPNCGVPLLKTKAAEEEAYSDVSEGSAAKKTDPPRSKKKRRKIPIIIAVVVLLIFAVSMCSGTSSDKSNEVDFLSIYNTYLDSTYAQVASDGSYLMIDTNPYDIDDYNDDTATAAVVLTIKTLGLPDSLVQKMNGTSALDGRQTEVYNGVEVSWKYHPDNGLEVLFSKN